MFIESFIISVIFGLLRKGNIKNLGLIHLKRISLLFVAFGVQLLIDYLGEGYLGGYGGLMHIVSYLMLFYFLWINGKALNVFMYLGTILNFLVILFNKGAMPVQTTYMPQYVIEKLSNSVTHSVMTVYTRLSWLGDIIFVKWPTKQMLSIGDIFLDVGVFILIQRIMLNTRTQKSFSNKEIKG